MTDKNKLSIKAIIAAVILGIILFLGIPLAIVLWSNAETQKMLDKGCIASGASNYLGTPTYWSCPNPEETQKFFDRGCTPTTRDEIGTTWSCPK